MEPDGIGALYLAYEKLKKNWKKKVILARREKKKKTNSQIPLWGWGCSPTALGYYYD